MIRKIGITGGIGSGKSVVTELLKTYAIPVYIADIEAKRLTNEDSRIRMSLIELFGEDLYTGGLLNKGKLAAIIFSDEEKRIQVNHIIHPVVREDFLAWAQKQKTHLVVVESAILFESGMDKLVDIKVNVNAPLNTRINRIINRDHISRQEAVKRIESQWTDEQRSGLSDFDVYNDDLSALIPQIENLFAFIRTYKKD